MPGEAVGGGRSLPAGNFGLLNAWSGPYPGSQGKGLRETPSLNAFEGNLDARYRLFGGYLYDDQDQQSRNGYYGYTAESHGALFGISLGIASGLDLAFYGAWSTTETEYNSIDAEAETDSVHFGLLGRYLIPFTETVNLRFTGSLGYSRLDNDMERTILGTRTEGSFDQSIYSAGLEAALDIYPAFAENLRISPFVSGTYLHLQQDGLSENGLAALHIGDSEADQFTTALGLGLAKDFRLSENCVLIPALAASWKHDFGDVEYGVTSNYVGQGTRFSSRSMDRERDAFHGGLSLDARWALENEKELGVKIGYGLESRESYLEQQAFVGLEFRF
jgi:outer membrane autotransporter protein